MQALAGAVQKPYLRNLFFRILCLYSEGVSLVMVVDGEATQLKWSTMDQREKASHGRGGACYHRNRRTGRRTQLNSEINEVCSREKGRGGRIAFVFFKVSSLGE
jgi:hypothetical protein